MLQFWSCLPILSRHSKNQVDTQIFISPLYPPHLFFIWSQRDNNSLWGDEETETNTKKIITVGLWRSEEHLKVTGRMGSCISWTFCRRGQILCSIIELYLPPEFKPVMLLLYLTCCGRFCIDFQITECSLLNLQKIVWGFYCWELLQGGGNKKKEFCAKACRITQLRSCIWFKAQTCNALPKLPTINFKLIL